MGRMRHKRDTAQFKDLSFAEQAKSISATLNNLQAAIRHHIRKSQDSQKTRAKCLGQVLRLAGRL